MVAVLPGLLSESDKTMVMMPRRITGLFPDEHPVVPKSSVMVFGNAPPDMETAAQVVVELVMSGSRAPVKPAVSATSFKILFASSVRFSLMACFPDKSKVVSISLKSTFLQEEKARMAKATNKYGVSFFIVIMFKFVLGLQQDKKVKPGKK